MVGLIIFDLIGLLLRVGIETTRLSYNAIYYLYNWYYSYNTTKNENISKENNKDNLLSRDKILIELTNEISRSDVETYNIEQLIQRIKELESENDYFKTKYNDDNIEPI